MTEPAVSVIHEDNWRARALWVQDVMMVRVVGSASDDCLHVQAQTGEARLIKKAELERDYFAFGGGDVFKPVFRPKRAICFEETATISASGGTVLVPRGDAVVEQWGGEIEVLPRHRFNLMYRIVGHSDTHPPEAPFVPNHP